MLLDLVPSAKQIFYPCFHFSQAKQKLSDCFFRILQDVDALLGELNFLPGTVFTTDLPYVDFLDRVHRAELKLRTKGMWEVPHPWLNLFVPASRIADFDRGVFRGILGGRTAGAGGPILIYPMNKHK